MITKASITWNVKQVTKMIAGGTITLDNPVQRGSVWNKEKKRNLIESVLLGFPIPQIYAKKTVIDPKAHASSVYDILDGKQRLLALYDFVNGAFNLSDEVAPVEDVAVDGLFFDDLPEDIKDIIYGFNLSIVYFDDITPEIERELFKRLNGGKAITSRQLSVANCNNLDDFRKLADLPVMKEILSEKDMDNKLFVPLLFKIYQMIALPIDEVVFSGGKFNKLMRDTTLTDSDVSMLSDYLAFAGKISEKLDGVARDKFLRETHFISFVPFIDDSKSADEYAEKITDFFEGHSPALAVYTEHCSNGVANKANVGGRHRALSVFFEEGED